MAAHFERHLGRGQLVLRDVRRLTFPARVYGALPCEGRPHWVLHTLGASLLPMAGRKGEERRFEFVMSLPEDWIPSERWPAYMFQRASTAILARSLAPDAGGVVSNSAEAVHGSPRAFGLLVAPSRQLGEHATFRTPSGGLVEVYAMYPLTLDDWELHQMGRLHTATLPEVIEQWRDMLR
ncbi:suppressor of fused domain protein [Polyangium jinanense]|uniref:Suppressor of fused domain protein n=2 Tax=Polyangium jinanense TaxID=2829994 RepID=A0A9X3XDB7_9BACT|nr:suppressor of fused domain protein [Polyangium jinanense]